MKQVISLFFLLPLSFVSFGQIYEYDCYLMPRFGLGYESAFKTHIGLGVDIRGTGFADWQSHNVSLSYENYRFDEGSAHGVAFNASLDLVLIHLGGSLTYLMKENRGRVSFKPQIGLTYFGLFYVTYSYAIGNLEGIFPDGYSRHGVEVGGTIRIARFYRQY